MSENIRWGILGTAAIAGRALIPAIKAARNGELKAVASRDFEKAAKFADTHGIPQAYGTYEELLSADDIDAVYIPLPTGMHAEWSCRAADAGKAVLCEKPLTANFADAEKLAAYFAERKLLLAEAIMYHYHPLNRCALEIIRSGKLGKLQMIYARFNGKIERSDDIRFDKALGGGALLDVGCYCVSVMRQMAGAEPETVAASAVCNETGADLQTVGLMQFPDGIIGHFGCGLQAQFDCSYGASGTDGRLLVERGAMCAWPGEEFIIKLETKDGSEEITVPAADHYQLMVEDFADSLLIGRQMAHTVDDSLCNMQVIDRLFAAAGI